MLFDQELVRNDRQEVKNETSVEDVVIGDGLKFLHRHVGVSVVKRSEESKQDFEKERYFHVLSY